MFLIVLVGSVTRSFLQNFPSLFPASFWHHTFSTPKSVMHFISFVSSFWVGLYSQSLLLYVVVVLFSFWVGLIFILFFTFYEIITNYLVSYCHFCFCLLLLLLLNIYLIDLQCSLLMRSYHIIPFFLLFLLLRFSL